MNNPIQGLLHVTGEHDTGKTTFALTCGAQPGEIAFVDDDVKSRSLVNQIGAKKFALYSDFVKDTEGKRELDAHAFGLQLIERMKKAAPKVIVWDTWTRFGKTCHPYVVQHASEFRQFWSPMGTIKGAEQWQMAFQYEAVLIEKLLDAAPLVILITHLKDHRIGDKKTGKKIPDAQKTLEEKSNFRLWLRHNPDSPAPIGLVLKRIEKLEVTKTGLHAINILPRKIKPCTWDKILAYWNEPMGERAPTSDETPDAFELSILDETLTPDQKEIFRLSSHEVESNPLEVQDRSSEVRELYVQKVTIPNIAKQLGISVNAVRVAIGNSNGVEKRNSKR